MVILLNRGRRHGAALAASLMLAPLGTAWAADPPAAPDPLVTPVPLGQSSMRTLNTKAMDPLWGSDSSAQAVAATQHLWTAARPANAPGENDDVPNPPWGIVLVTVNDPLAASSAVPLVHFPDDAAILFVTKTGILQITLDKTKRLGPTGISPDSNLDVIVVGDAANPGVLRDLSTLKLKHDEITMPDATVIALKCCRGIAHIYVFGGPDQVSAAVEQQLSQYGSVSRTGNGDPIAFNKPPKSDPVSSVIASAKMWHPIGKVGCNITGPDHGFTLVNVNDWQATIASAPLSHIGSHALLLTDNAGQLPKVLKNYFTTVAPSYPNTPPRSVYNTSYVLGTFAQVSWPQRAKVDLVSEVSNRRVWKQGTGSMYSARML